MEAFIIVILTFLGSYLLTIVAGLFKEKNKDSLKNFEPFNLKEYANRKKN
jgi:hypothetical protein